MQTENKKQIELLLTAEITNFFEMADALSCIDALTYLMLSIDEDVDPLTSMDTVNLRPLMRMLVKLARLQLTPVR